MNNEQLIIFTRYPEPGKTKTRMIPILGEKGAATLQAKMTEYTIAQARQLLSDRLSIAVYFGGGNQLLMQKWLGFDLDYREQDKGDLGHRMASAFKQSFEAGIEQIVMIGIDCPDLSVSLLNEAFEALKEQELVLGPAADGGYYLIGLNRFIPELFTEISWGTSEVLVKTKNIAQQLELNIYYLPLLHDIDRPEDLPLWEQRKS